MARRGLTASRPARHLGTALLLLSLLGGCRSAKVRAVRQVDASELCPDVLPGERWQSAPWSGGCDWVRLDAREGIEVPHDLGRPPASVLVYLSFVPSGAEAVLAAGDMARIVEVTATSVTVANATEQPMYARLVLW